MSQRSILFFALAIVLALAAVWAARSWLEGRSPGTTAATVVTVPVVVAGVDIPIGGMLGERQLSSVDWPKRYVPDGAFSDEEQVDKRVTRRPLVAGEVILEASLLARGSEAGMVSVISEAKRAVSVKVDSVIGVAGFVTPGSHVDVLATLRRLDQKPALPYSKVILQDIRVLAVDQRMEKADNGEPEVVSAVTLEVDPKQAERLIYSAHEGRLQLALRNPGDRETVETRSVSVADLLGRRSRSTGRARRKSVQLLKGSKISVKWF